MANFEKKQIKIIGKADEKTEKLKKKS